MVNKVDMVTAPRSLHPDCTCHHLPSRLTSLHLTAPPLPQNAQPGLGALASGRLGLCGCLCCGIYVILIFSKSIFPIRLWAACSKEQVVSSVDLPVMPRAVLAVVSILRDSTQHLSIMPENSVSKHDCRKLPSASIFFLLRLSNFHYSVKNPFVMYSVTYLF